MTPQDLKEQLLQREAYALGYKNGSTDTIKWMAEQMQKEADPHSKPQDPGCTEVKS